MGESTGGRCRFRHCDFAVYAYVAPAARCESGRLANGRQQVDHCCGAASGVADHHTAGFFPVHRQTAGIDGQPDPWRYRAGDPYGRRDRSPNGNRNIYFYGDGDSKPLTNADANHFGDTHSDANADSDGTICADQCLPVGN